jgi:hypothetical protein
VFRQPRETHASRRTGVHLARIAGAAEAPAAVPARRTLTPHIRNRGRDFRGHWRVAKKHTRQLPRKMAANHVGTSFALRSRAMRRTWGEVLLTIGTLAILMMVLVAIDPGVREQVSMRVSAPSASIADASHHARDLTTVIAQAAHNQSLEHAPLLIFGLAATVLTLFMLRT